MLACPAALLLLACLPQAAAGLPARDAQGPGPKQERQAAVELPEGLRASLAEVSSRREAGELDAARAQLTEIVAGEVYAELLRQEHDVVLAGLSSLDRVAESLGALDIQLRVRERRVERLVERLEADHPELLRATLDLAIARGRTGDVEGANVLAEQVHEARERLLDEDDPDLLTSKHVLALTCKMLGDLERALDLEEDVHAARERTLPEDDLALLGTKHNLAVTRKLLGDLEGALELEERVHAARQRLLPPDHPELLSIKQNLAVTRADLGDLRGALELEEHVHAVRQRSLPADHLELLAAKQNLAVTRAQLGDLAGARQLHEYVHATLQRLLPPDSPDLLSAKLNLANLRGQVGDLDGALELAEHVHAAWERLLPPDHTDLLLAKASLAVRRSGLGDLAGALELAEYVHDVRKRLLPPDHPYVLAAESNLAAIRRQRGEHAEARALFEHVQVVQEQSLIAEHPDLLLTKSNLALTYKELDDLRAAHELEEHVHRVWDRLLPPDHHELLRAKTNLALTRRDLGDLDGARALTLSLMQGQAARASALLLEPPRIARAAALDELHRFSSTLLLTDSTSSEVLELDEELFSLLESLRLVSTSSSELALAAARFFELQELRDRAANARRRLNDLSLSPPEDASALSSWRAEVVKAAEDRDRLERKLREGLAERGILPELPSAARVAEALGQDSTLVSFLRYSKAFERDPETGESPPSVDSLLAFVVTSDGLVKRVELGPSAEIEALAIGWRGLLGKPIERGVGVEATAREEASVGRALCKKLLEPCLTGALPASVHVVLDDFLHMVPVDALPWDDDRRLGEVVRVRFEVSTRRFLHEARRPADGKGTLLAMGGIDFEATEIGLPEGRLAVVTTPPLSASIARKGAPGSFAPLIQSLYEVQAVGGLYEDLVGGEPVLLEGAGASKRALVELAPQARFLHVATHGWFAPETFKSMIDSAEDQAERERFSRADDTLRGFAPETLCGLAFAGANHGKNALGKVPGIMTAEELATLDLASCELAVLSACETNVGLRRAGQGIQSLQAALHAAGARSAITSLWRVDDAAARRLMELFYTKLWKDGLGKADALWGAKMALRTEKHPVRDWAGWVLTGAPD